MNLRFTIHGLRKALQNRRHREPIQVPQGQMTIARSFNCVKNGEDGKAPQGRQKFSVVPSGLDLIRSVFPPLKRRAIFGRHFVTSK
jgi:hypothetical protein